MTPSAIIRARMQTTASWASSGRTTTARRCGHKPGNAQGQLGGRGYSEPSQRGSPPLFVGACRVGEPICASWAETGTVAPVSAIRRAPAAVGFPPPTALWRLHLALRRPRCRWRRPGSSPANRRGDRRPRRARPSSTFEARRRQKPAKEGMHRRGDPHLARQQPPKMLQSVAVPAGTGKTHFLVALGQSAIDAGHHVSWFSLEALGALMRRHRADDTTTRAIRRIMRAELIVIDDIGLLPVAAETAEALYRVVDAAYERRSLAISSNLHPSGFDELMPKTIANSTVDRLMHHAHLVITSGDSIRLTDATTGKGVKPLNEQPGRSTGRHWAVLVATAGQFCWPSPGRNHWPLSCTCCGNSRCTHRMDRRS